MLGFYLDCSNQYYDTEGKVGFWIHMVVSVRDSPSDLWGGTYQILVGMERYEDDKLIFVVVAYTPYIYIFCIVPNK